MDVKGGAFPRSQGGLVFRGVAQLNLDSKGRLAVPARFRDALTARCSGHLVVTADSDRCLLIYPLPDWEPIEQKLMALSSFNAQIRELQRRLVGYAEDVVMDATGRILVPPALRNYAQLEKAVVLVGQGNKFELWNKDSWDAAHGEGRAASAPAVCRRSWRASPCERGLTYRGPVGAGSRRFEGARRRLLRRLHVRSRRAQPADSGAAGKRGTADRARSRPAGGQRREEEIDDGRFRMLHGRFGRLAELAAGAGVTRGGRHPARSRRVLAAARRSRARLQLPLRRAARHAHGHGPRHHRRAMAGARGRNGNPGGHKKSWRRTVC